MQNTPTEVRTTTCPPLATDGRVGPGYIPSERISFDHLLNEREAQRFTVERVFSNQLSWIDFL